MQTKYSIKIGDRFTRLTVIGTADPVKIISKSGKSYTRRYFHCICDCGKKVKLAGQNLVDNGNTKSCGCLAKELRQQKRLSNNRGIINQIILGYKRKERGGRFGWSLEYNDVAYLIQQPCYYCGTVNSNKKINRLNPAGYEYNGIDRIDSSKGYTIDNVVPCCKTCNIAKRDMSQEYFINWIMKAALHIKKNGLQK
jgi:hypothetical protein